MRRREFLTGVAAPAVVGITMTGCDVRRLAGFVDRGGARAGRALALVTADLEAHVAVVEVKGCGVLERIPTREGPASIEAGGGQAIVAHSDEGAISLIEWQPFRVRRVLGGMSEPRYTAVAPDGRLAFVTDAGTGEVLVIDLARGRVAGGGEVGALARHITISPDGRTAWVALGMEAPSVVVVDLSDPLRPRPTGELELPFLAHDVACSPNGTRLWVSSGDERRIALYSPSGASPLAVLPSTAPPQHVSFGAGHAFVTSGDDGALWVQRVNDGHVVRRSGVAKGSFNVQHGAGHVVTPSLDDGTVTIADEGGRMLISGRVAEAAHDACLVIA